MKRIYFVFLIMILLLPQLGYADRVTINLRQGWNMFSLPVNKITTKEELFRGCSVKSSLYHYNSIDRKYEIKDSIEPGYGYWIYLASSCSISVDGNAVNVENIFDLKFGWNQIGSISAPIEFQSIKGICDIKGGPWRYNPSTRMYEFASILEPGYGYWVYSSGDCRLGAVSPPEIKRMIFEGGGDTAFIASKADMHMSHFEQGWRVPQIHALNSNVISLLYRNIRAVYKTADEYQTFVNNGWILKNSTGQPVTSTVFNYFIVDVGNPEYQQWVANWMKNYLDQYGYNGVFLDNCLPSTEIFWSTSSTPINPRTGNPWTSIELKLAVISIVNKTKEAIGNKLVVGNGILYGDRFFNTIYNQGYVDLLTKSKIDGIESEAWIMDIETKQWYSEDKWNKSINFVVWLESNFLNKGTNKVFLPVAQNIAPYDGGGEKLPTGATKEQYALYTYASLALAFSSNTSYLNFGYYSDSYADNLFGIKLGSPVGKHYIISGTHVYARNFTDSKVLVNPTSNDYTVNLGVDYKKLDGTIVSSITMSAHTGEILFRTAPRACSDGTLYGQCSSTKPKYCDNGILIDKCSTCGCSSGFCQPDGTCQSVSSCDSQCKSQGFNSGICRTSCQSGESSIGQDGCSSGNLCCCKQTSACTSCGSWINGACNTGGCVNQRQQTRTSTPSSCTLCPDEQGTSKCIDDISCGAQNGIQVKGIQWYCDPDCYKSTSSYSSTKATQALDNLTFYIPHTNYIYLDVWVNASTDNITVTPKYDSKNDYISAIQKAKAEGYKIAMRVRHRPSPYDFKPANLDLWIKNYTKAVVFWAQLAQSNNVELFGIVNEFNKWDNDAYSSYWTSLINQARAVYSGKIYANLNFWDTNELFNQKLSANWLKSLDYIAISSYWKMCTASGASVDQLVQNWHSYVGGSSLNGKDIVEQMKTLSDTHGKPIIIVTGLSSAQGACLTPWAWEYSTADMQEQNNWYEAMFKVFNDKPWIYGYLFDSAWYTFKVTSPTTSTEFVVQGKPAEQTIEKWFSLSPTCTSCGSWINRTCNTGGCVNQRQQTRTCTPTGCAPTDGLGTSKCIDDIYCGALCGNNIIEGTEQCDGTNLNGKTCTSLGYIGGTLKCTNCFFDTSGCTGGAQFRVTVDTSKVIGSNNFSIGFMTDWSWPSFVSNSITRQLIKDADFKLVRVFDFRTTSPKLMPCNSWDVAKNNCTSWDWTQVDLFTQKVFEIGAEPLFALSYIRDNIQNYIPPGMPINSTTELPNLASYAVYASEWVKHFKQKGWSVRYYEIGNEPFAYFGWNPSPSNSLKLSYYVDLWNFVARAMRKENPDILLSQDAITQTNVFKYWLLHGDNVDYLDFHKYDCGTWNKSSSSYYSDEKLFGLAESSHYETSGSFYGVKESQQKWLASRGKLLPVINSESNLNSAWEGGTDPRLQQMVGAVWKALELRNGILSGAIYSVYYEFSSSSTTNAQSGGHGFGMINSYNNKPWYPYYVQKWIGNNLDVGDSLKQSTSTSSNIRTLTWTNNGKLSILLIHNSTATETVSLNGVAGQLSYQKIDDPSGTSYLTNAIVQSGTIDAGSIITLNGYTVMLLQTSTTQNSCDSQCKAQEFSSGTCRAGSSTNLPSPTTFNTITNSRDGTGGKAFHTHNNLINMFKTLFDQYPGYASYEPIGKTYEGRDIVLFKIGNPNGGKVLWDGSLHGWEDVGSEVEYLISKWLLENGTTGLDQTAKKIIESNLILFVPVINMDSYERQNRNFTSCSYGVDLNRNFVNGWNSASCGNMNYPGPSGASEKETQAMRSVFQTYKPDFYLNTHYGGGQYMSSAGSTFVETQLIQSITQVSTQRGVTPYSMSTGGGGGAGQAYGDAKQLGALSSWFIEINDDNHYLSGASRTTSCGCYGHVCDTYQDVVNTAYPRMLPIFIAMASASAVTPSITCQSGETDIGQNGCSSGYGCCCSGVVQKCSDGTAYGSCSSTKPKYCSSGTLINKCSQCGCPAGQSCQADESCKSVTPTGTIWGANLYVPKYNNTHPSLNAPKYLNNTVFQAAKDMGITHIILWQYNFNDNAQTITQAQMVDAVSRMKNYGLQPIIVLDYDVAKAVALVQALGSNCMIYEVCKEPHVSGSTCAADETTYANNWNAVVNACRQVNPNAMYGGPAVGAIPGTSPRSETWMRKWLEQCDGDFVSVHAFYDPIDSQSNIVSRASTETTSDVAYLKGILADYGKQNLPIVYSEVQWTAAETTNGWDMDQTFNDNFANSLMSTMEEQNVYAAMYWTLLGYNNNFAIIRPPAQNYQKKPQYYSIQSYLTSVTQTCSDRTPYGQCNNTNKPKYCSSGTLINKCSQCGCPAGQSCNTTSNACYSSMSTEIDNYLNYMMKNNQTYLTSPMYTSLWVDSKTFLGTPINNKQDIINYFDSKQNKTDGSWVGGGGSWTKMFDTGRVLLAYYELSATPAKSLDTFFSDYDTWDEAKNYMLNTGSGDARNMYHVLVGWATYYHEYPSWMNDFFNEAEKDLSWTTNTDFHKRTHILYSYVIARRPFPNLDGIIDETLREQSADGHWDGSQYNFYSDHGDVYFTSIQISLLNEILKLYPGHRTAEIQTSLEKAKVWTSSNYHTVALDGKVNGYFGSIMNLEHGIFEGILCAGQTGVISANVDMTFDDLVRLINNPILPTYSSPPIPNDVWAEWRNRTTKENLWKDLWNVHGLSGKIRVAGKSVQGRDIYLFEAGNPNAPALFVDAEIHGNEDHPNELLLRFAYWLLNGENNGNTTAQKIMQNNRILFMPIVDTDLSDRKSTSTFERNNVNGVNLNRNFEYNWASSTDPEKGPSAASEPETQTIKTVFVTYKPRVYMNLHVGAFMARAYGNSTLSNQIISNTPTFSSYFNSVYGGTHFGAGYSSSDAVDDSLGVSSWLIEFFVQDETKIEYNGWRHDSTSLDILENRYYPKFEEMLIGTLRAIE